MISDTRSAAEEYRYEALYPSRFNLRGYDLEGISGFSSFDAARMVSRSGFGASSDDDGGTVSGDRLYSSGLLVDVFRKLIGRLPSPDDNASTDVYLPLHDESDR